MKATNQNVSIAANTSALILAAGESSRFWPLSAGRHKSLFELDGVSLLARTIRSLAQIGVVDIVVVQSPRPPSGNVVLPSDVLDSDGSSKLRFIEQPVPAGQGDAILRSVDSLGRQFLVVQPENINAGIVGAQLINARRTADEVVVAAARRPDFSLYAVVEQNDGLVESIVEKPAVASTAAPLCSMGIYLVAEPFVETLRSVDPDPASLVAAIARAAKSKVARVVETTEPFLPLKYPEHLWAYVDYLKLSAPITDAVDRAMQNYVDFISEDKAADASLMLPNTIVAKGVTLGLGVRFATDRPTERMQPTVIGPNATIGSSVTITPGVKVGAYATVGHGANVTRDVPDFGVLT